MDNSLNWKNQTYKSYTVLLQIYKNVFVIFYSGERAKSKILKICDAFGANCYPFTDDLGKQFQMTTEVHLIFSSGFLPGLAKVENIYWPYDTLSCLIVVSHKKQSLHYLNLLGVRETFWIEDYHWGWIVSPQHSFEDNWLLLWAVEPSGWFYCSYILVLLLSFDN